MVTILFTKIKGPLPPHLWEHYFASLPVRLQERIIRTNNWMAQHSRLFSKLLLWEVSQMLYPNELNLSNIKYSDCGRPYLSSNIDFNISHSGEYVICAVATGVRLGVDIEKIKPVSIDSFEGLFSIETIVSIKQSRCILNDFYTQWTIMESVTKAEGGGLFTSFKSISVEKDIAILNGKRWYIQPINLDPNYITHLATDILVKTVIIKQLCYY